MAFPNGVYEKIFSEDEKENVVYGEVFKDIPH